MTATPLGERLGTLLGEDGFDLASVVADVGTEVTDIELPGTALDLGEVTAGLDGLGELDTTGLLGAVSRATQDSAGTLARLPATGELLGPLADLLVPVRLLLDPGSRGLLDRMATTGAAGPPATGLGSLTAAFGRLQAVLAEPEVASSVDALTGLVPGLSLQNVLDLVRGPAPGLAALVRLVGALMAAESAVRELSVLGSGVERLLDQDRVDAARARVAALANGSVVVAAIGAADPHDAVEADRIATMAREVRGTIEATVDLLRTGLGFGEAALVAVDVPTLDARLRAATEQVVEDDVPAVADLARTLSGWLAPVLAFEVPVRAPSPDLLWDEVAAVAGRLADAVDDLDPAALFEPVTAQVRAGLGALGEIETRAREVVAVVRAALDTVLEAASALDATAVVDAIRLVLDPVEAAIRSVEEVVGAAEAAVRTVAETITAQMADVEAHIGDAAGDVAAAFERVRGFVAGLHLAELGAEIQAALDPVVAALQSAELSPYFDTAVDVMETTADVVAAVPVDLLPDDVRADLSEATAPVKAIDFDAEVVVPLLAQLDEIRAGVDVAVLEGVRLAQQEVVAFLEEHDPEGALVTFEAEVFDPFLAQVRALDPAEALAPVHDLLAEAAAALGTVDLRELLAPVDAAFDSVLDVVDALQPSVLLQPVLGEVSETVGSVRETLALDTWQERLDAADGVIDSLAARVDLTPLAALLAGLWDDLVATVRSPEPNRPSGVGVLVSGLLQSTPLVVRPEAFDTVRGWVGGAVDAAADVHDRIAEAAGALGRAVEVVDGLDPVPLTVALTTAYDAVTAAAADLPEDSVLRGRVLEELAGADPRETLGTLVAGRERYLTLLRQVADLVAGMTADGRSELAAVSRGLRDALRPLTVVPQRLRDLLAGLGVEVGTDLRDAVADLLAASPPERVLAPLIPVVAGLRDQVVRAVREGLLAPLQVALDDVAGVLDALDVSFVVDEIEPVWADIRSTVVELRPATLLEPTIAQLDALVETVRTLDPLTSVEPVLVTMRDAVARVAEQFRPTVVARPALLAYDEVVAAVAAVDVGRVLEPVLAALDSIAAQLDDGLVRTGDALSELQEALP